MQQCAMVCEGQATSDDDNDDKKDGDNDVLHTPGHMVPKLATESRAPLICPELP